MGKGLKWMRFCIEVLVWVALTGLFVAGWDWLLRGAGFLTRLQLLPAAMGFAMTVFVGWLLVTLVFGRIYCSTVCPMGAFQDAVARVRRLFLKYPYRFAAAHSRLRYGVLLLTLGCLMLSVAAVPMLLDPYSQWGRIAVELVGPVLGRVASVSLAGVLIAGVTALLIGATAWMRGRLWCNTVCPVGSTLGVVSRFAIFHIDIDTDRCTQCRRCEYACKAQCIDLESHTVDMSRCVVCFDCLTGCGSDAIHYTPKYHRLSWPLMMRARTTREGGGAVTAATPGPKAIDRRHFLRTGMILAAAPLVLKADKVLAAVGPREPERGSIPLPQLPPIMPPGAPDRRTFLRRCTSCGLCMANCPTGVLRPSVMEYGVGRMLHPMMDFDRAACSYECTRCNNLCPTGALTPLTLAEKHTTRIGLAAVIKDNCVGCGRCARACPYHAIEMTPGDTPSGRLPQVLRERCMGCGACQNVCPVTPNKAIYVHGED